MARKNLCGGCEYFQVDMGRYVTGHGECRKHAPRVVPGDEETRRETLFPHVGKAEWCGEFKAKR